MKILLGVCGGIAAYKAAELLRTLQECAVDVQVAMTASAQEFVKPLTFAALTGKRVYTSLWEPSGEPAEGESSNFEIEHIAVAQAIDALVVAPATANILAKFANGIADDFLSTLYLATTKPVIIAPAMNVNMWQHPATQANLQILQQRGVRIVEPGAGYLACGMTGSGRLADVDAIANAVLSVLAPKNDLTAETVLITAGGTREPIDPVRFIGNRSSGKMGHALADAAIARGANVILVTASPLPDPAGCKVLRVATAAEMERAVLHELPEATVVIKAAAVADFRVRDVAGNKLRRGGPLTLELEPTEDIVAKVVARKGRGTIVIAFAAELKNLEANARAKLLRKGADAIVANDISSPEFGFDSERNAGLFLTPDRTRTLAPATKREMADRILDELLAMREAIPLPQASTEPAKK
ncbi:MAG TPA: bifunctional phosphopantothenoylcysteine decarboxylase/phosphopantothenate--cysteine ligase CoaBC [Acidobacteriaceae bacterium]|nr:bifunctional phosphopantothenoylcysteine decarboxylase/phosphopantothenate--cysteine ligase CoaBC [Acidobacteriaceae bacterium]